MESGEKIKLVAQEPEVENCRECSGLMVNLDTDQLQPGDLTTLKLAGVKISNPETDKAVCISCEYKTFGRKVSDFFDSDDDDDSDFFKPSSPSISSFPSIFRGGSSFGGFGGFGGGSFGGGGANRAF